MLYRITIALAASVLCLGAQSLPGEQVNHQFYPVLTDAQGECTLAVKVHVTGFNNPLPGTVLREGRHARLPSPYRTVVRLADAMKAGNEAEILALHEPDAGDQVELRFGGQLDDIAEFRAGSRVFAGHCAWYGDYAKVMYLTVTSDGTAYPWEETVEMVGADYLISDDLTDRSFPSLLSNAIAEAQVQYDNRPCEVDGMPTVQIGVLGGDDAVVTLGDVEGGRHPVMLAAAVEALDDPVDLQDYQGEDVQFTFMADLLAQYLSGADEAEIASRWWIPSGLGWSLEGDGAFDPFRWGSSEKDEIDLRCVGRLAAGGSSFLLLQDKGRPVMLWVGVHGGKMVVAPACPGGDEVRTRAALTMFDSTIAAALVGLVQ